MSAVVSSARIIDFAAAKARRHPAADGNGAAAGILLQLVDDGRDTRLAPWDGEVGAARALAMLATALAIVAPGREG
jgi:hypothetical protein